MNLLITLYYYIIVWRKKEMNNNYIGKKINRLTIIADDPNKKGYYICDCDCGTKGKSISAYHSAAM